MKYLNILLPLALLSSSVGFSQSASDIVGSYEGKFTAVNGDELSPQANIDFYLNPSRGGYDLNANVILGGALISFQNAVYIPMTSKLTAQGSLQAEMENIQLSLDCVRNSDASLDCVYVSSLIAGVAKIHLAKK